LRLWSSLRSKHQTRFLPHKTQHPNGAPLKKLEPLSLAKESFSSIALS
jgi:hypothetical protein